jgi:hypothetical protein
MTSAGPVSLGPKFLDLFDQVRERINTRKLDLNIFRENLYLNIKTH